MTKMIKRDLLEIILSHTSRKEVVIIYGARQTGKSTLLDMLAQEIDLKILNCEDPIISDVLLTKNTAQIKSLFDRQVYIAFDEAQSIENIGAILKLLFDSKSVSQKLIATGSSSFELANKVGEPLTGRNTSFTLLPLSLNEINSQKPWLQILQNLHEYLIYGLYPGLAEYSPNDKRLKLISLSGDYLYKDILKHEQVKNPEILRKLLKAVALQIGNIISTNELSNLLGIAKQTVERYLNLLEKSFIIYSIGSYSSNLRNELKKSKKYYFLDLGIRNAVLNNFSKIEDRGDKGALWENFCINELMKMNNNKMKFPNYYFWRTYDGAEIDLLIEYDGQLKAYEFKWNSSKKAKIPLSFSKKYQVSELEVIQPDKLHLLK